MYCRGRNRTLGQDPQSWEIASDLSGEEESSSNVKAVPKVSKRPKVTMDPGYTYSASSSSTPSDEISKAEKLGRIILDRADGIVTREQSTTEIRRVQSTEILERDQSTGILKKDHSTRIIKKDQSTRIVKRGQSPGVRRDKSPGVRRDKSPGVKRNKSPGVKRNKSPGAKRDQSPGLRRDQSITHQSRIEVTKSEPVKYTLQPSLKLQGSSKSRGKNVKKSSKGVSNRKKAVNSTQKLLKQGLRELKKLKRKQTNKRFTFYFRLPRTIGVGTSKEYQSREDRDEEEKSSKPVESIKGVGPVNAARLAAKGVTTARNLYGQFLIKGPEFPQYLKSLGLDAMSAARIYESLKKLDVSEL